MEEGGAPLLHHEGNSLFLLTMLGFGSVVKCNNLVECKERVSFVNGGQHLWRIAWLGLSLFPLVFAFMLEDHNGCYSYGKGLLAWGFGEAVHGLWVVASLWCILGQSIIPMVLTCSDVPLHYIVRSVKGFGALSGAHFSCSPKRSTSPLGCCHF
eukprot:Gb_38759 [translate_table: standard]